MTDTQNKKYRGLIRSIFLAEGFTIKDGQTDLKEYVYRAAERLIDEIKAERGLNNHPASQEADKEKAR